MDPVDSTIEIYLNPEDRYSYSQAPAKRPLRICGLVAAPLHTRRDDLGNLGFRPAGTCGVVHLSAVVRTVSIVPIPAAR